MLPIQQMFINKNYYLRRPVDKIQYIIIHDTANKGVGAGVDNHYRYFTSIGAREASCDFFVDDEKIGQFIDYRTQCSWQVRWEDSVYGITNRNAIGMEICINSDGDYAKAMQNAIELTAYLCKELNIPETNVVRHYDATRKMCPRTMSANNWQLWKEFKQRLHLELNPIKEEVEVEKWKLDAIDYLYNQGVLSDPTQWKKKINEPAPVWMVMILMMNLSKVLINRK